jgi:hypothetical protein
VSIISIIDVFSTSSLKLKGLYRIFADRILSFAWAIASGAQKGIDA